MKLRTESFASYYQYSNWTRIRTPSHDRTLFWAPSSGSREKRWYHAISFWHFISLPLAFFVLVGADIFQLSQFTTANTMPRNLQALESVFFLKVGTQLGLFRKTTVILRSMFTPYCFTSCFFKAFPMSCGRLILFTDLNGYSCWNYYILMLSYYSLYHKNSYFSVFGFV